MRILVWFTLGFGGACALGSFLWNVQWALIPAVIALVAALFIRKIRKSWDLRPVVLAALGFLVGLGWFLGYDRIYTQPVRELEGRTRDLTMTSYKYSWETDYGSCVDCYLDLEGKRYRVRVYLDESEVIEPWTTIRMPVQVRLTTDGGMEEPTFHRSNGILALCYQRGDMELTTGEESVYGSWIIWLEEFRHGVSRILEDTFPDETAAFAKAILLGDRNDISYELNTAFKVSGISHIIAVSGLHMSILFGVMYTLTGKRRWLMALVGIPAAVLFMALVGFTPSVTRAGIMQILIILALCLNREYDPSTALAFSSLVMLMINPLVASSVGFQLSVGSVTGIFLFLNPCKEWLQKRIPEGKRKLTKRLRAWFVSGVCVTLCAQVITLPLVGCYFGTVSLIGVMTNLAVLWLISFVFYGVMAVSLLGAVSVSVATVAAVPVVLVIRAVLLVAKTLAGLPFAAVYTESVYINLWLILCGGLVLSVILGKDKRPLVSLLVAGFGLCLAMCLSWIEPMLWDHHVTILDVGQGQSIILQHGGKTYVVDCGGDYEDSAADRCAQMLLSRGISRIDGLILTHMDVDHAGGAEYLMSRIAVDALYLPCGAELEGENRFFVIEDMMIESDGMKLTLFAPEIQGNGNESSVAVLFQTEKCDTLITGDLSGLWERMLLNRAELPDVELLVVGHHGASDATSQELLDTVKPETAFISVGKDNRYNHPHQTVLDRLAAFGCEIFRTDLSGDLVYRR